MSDATNSGDSHRTWVQVRFRQDADFGSVDHVWTTELDYNFPETPEVGDVIVMLGAEREVIPSGVDSDGTINFVTKYEGASVRVPMEVVSRVWFRDGVLLVSDVEIEADDAETMELLLHALDMIGFTSSTTPGMSADG